MVFKSRDFRISKNRFFDFDTRNGSSTDRYEPVCSIYDQVNYEAWHNLFTNGLDPTTGKINPVHME